MHMPHNAIEGLLSAFISVECMYIQDALCEHLLLYAFLGEATHCLACNLLTSSIRTAWDAAAAAAAWRMPSWEDATLAQLR